MKYIYCPITDKVVPKGEEYQLENYQIIPDSMPGFVSDVDGKYYDSKSAIKKLYKEKGLVITHGLGLKSWTEKQAQMNENRVRESYERVIKRK